ncbi:hypothetical protein CHUBBYTHOR_15 [Shigella phage ChubbyThor]|uniref:Hypothetical phage protein n=1 Tax=Shigella phage Ag3 TaxID=637730 RepID=C8XUU1_9CAUD|nr:hypothetical protein phiSboM-AG3_gp187 [Shigella phage Ag3]ACO94421.1 hypothetical phage protein [Shigella phage Ag3]UGO46953.1 hypothetical protein CHUBBYTHOR_15 [Shigella phage ChubbyThor]
MKAFSDFVNNRLQEIDHPLMKGKTPLTTQEMVKTINDYSGIQFKHASSKQGGLQRLDHQIELGYRTTVGGKTVSVNTSFRPIDQATIRKLDLDKNITSGMDNTHYENSEIIFEVGGDGYYKTMKGKNDGNTKSINELKNELKTAGSALKSSKNSEDLVEKLKSAGYQSF